MFYVNQRVVCIDDNAIEVDGRRRLYAGRTYVIAAIATSREVALGSRPHPDFPDSKQKVHLVGVERWFLGIRSPYAAERFRPVVKRKTDISVFTEMLNGQPVEV